MKNYILKFSYLLFALLLLCSAVYSYALIDLDLTLFNNPIWQLFRQNIIQLGYFQRHTSTLIYISIIVLLFVFHFYFVSKHKKINVFLVTGIIATIMFFSYPFLSHDLFNYMFDAKILTFYHLNPYTHKGLDFPVDPWLRFMQWTHRNYPYGPTFLGITVIPSFLSLGKFIIAFALFKLLTVTSYVVSVYGLCKLNKKWALIFATSPLIIIEGLMSNHNDLLAVALAIVGIVLVTKNKNIWGRIMLVLSAGIKYTTLPLILFSKNNKIINHILGIGIVSLLIYMCVTLNVQPWYFITLFSLVWYYEKLGMDLNIFFAGLLLSYVPFIFYGNWTNETVSIRFQIIMLSIIMNVIFLFFKYCIFKKVKSRS